MKRLLILPLLIISALTIYAQEYMVIETNSGTKKEIKTDDVKRVFFETREVSNNPYNPQGEEGTPVDLGLSVLWADWNVGASSVYDTGGLYGWGDPTGDKTSTDLDDYPCPYPVPNDISGTKYDIARARWGGAWRMPTFEEFKELARINLSNVYINGEYYTEAKANNGNKIILPKAEGYRYDENIYPLFSLYWTATLSNTDNRNARTIRFEDGNMSYFTNGWERYYGCCIRPVMDKKVEISFILYQIDASITKNSVTICGNIKGETDRYQLGILYGTSQNLTGENGTFQTIGKSETFNVSLYGLEPGTTYYYRPVGLRNGKYCMGQVKSFTTKNASSYAIGDFYPNSNNPEGVVFDVSDGGLHGKIVSLDEISSVKWSYDITWMPNCSDKDDGSRNKMSRSRSQLAGWCYDHGDNWYCPARFELAKLSKTTLSKVNATLVSKGYTKHEGFYWSSTQYGSTAEDLAYVVTVAEDQYAGKIGGQSFYNTKDQTRKGIAVRKF